jgi:hypothetical protein
MVVNVFNIPYPIAPRELVDFNILNQLAQIVSNDAPYLALYYHEEQVVAEFNGKFYVLNINTPLYNLSRSFNFIVEDGFFFDDVQNAEVHFDLQELRDRTLSQLRDNYHTFTLYVVAI